MWSTDITATLVQVVYQAFRDGQGGDNGFKRETWTKATIKATSLSTRRGSITWDKAKNK